jgi:hypothetical protein
MIRPNFAPAAEDIGRESIAGRARLHAHRALTPRAWIRLSGGRAICPALNALPCAHPPCRLHRTVPADAGARGTERRTLGVSLTMKTVKEYRQQADECRELAKRARSADEREAILAIAAGWEKLAAARARKITNERPLPKAR